MSISKVFQSVGIKGSGIVFNILDTTINNQGIVFQVDTRFRTITSAPNTTWIMGDVFANTINTSNLLNTVGITIEEKNVNPGTTLPGFGNIWVKDTSPNVLMYTDDTGADFVINGAGGGDVSGPALSTNNAIVRYAGTSGKIIKNSALVLDDDDNIDKNGNHFIYEDGSSISVGTNALNSIITSSSCTAVGFSAMNANTTGSDNTAVGAGSLISNISGINNTAVGSATLFTNVTGNNNTAIGAGTLNVNTESDNTAIGSRALISNTSGTNNTAVGSGALFLNNTGNNNTALGTGTLTENIASDNTSIGFEALQSNTTGTNNTAVGATALQNNIISHSCTAVGYAALTSNTAADNTAVGSLALRVNTLGINNTAVGMNSLTSNTTGNGCTAMGKNALQFNITGTENTSIGSSTLSVNVSGIRNTVVGANSGSSIISGNNNTILGYSSGSLITGNDNISIGNFGTASDAGTIRIGTIGTHAETYTSGILFKEQQDVAEIAAGAAILLLPSDLLAGIMANNDDQLRVWTLPSAADMFIALPTMEINQSFDFVIINEAPTPGMFVQLIAGVNNTIRGNEFILSQGLSGMWRLRKTTATEYIVYRIGSQ